MSKLNPWKATLLLCCLSSALVSAQAPRPTTAPKPGNDKPITTAEVEAMTADVLKQTSELRGLKLLKPIKSGVKSRTDIEQMVVKNFDEESTPAELDADYKMLLAFGLVPKGFQYREFLIKLLTEQIAGFYDPKKKELNLADWNPLEAQRMVMAHELTHALQDQHFDLLRFDKWPKGDSDREAAIHALIEGDATALMMDYLMKPMGRSVTQLPKSILDQMNSQTGAPGMDVMNSAPNAIREGLMFSYTYGLGFVYRLLKDKGWEGVSKAYTDLPQSCEQILHYEKYAAREMPIKIELADATSVLGKGWKRIKFDVNGEFGYYLTLAEYLTKDTARKASEGWGGDQFALYENATKTNTTLVHLSAWDMDKDAEEFFHAYAERTAKRYPQVKANSLPNQFVYATPDGVTMIELRGKQVLVLEGAAAASVKALAAKGWESKIVSSQ
ncbi:MAG: DUF6782 family putative metallopeptidase [Blastocatellia bacterium]